MLQNAKDRLNISIGTTCVVVSVAVKDYVLQTHIQTHKQTHIQTHIQTVLLFGGFAT